MRRFCWCKRVNGWGLLGTRKAIVPGSEIATNRIRGKDNGSMESVAEEPPTVALASTEMPRFADGTTSMQELLRQLAESIANETMGAEAEQLCEETGTSRNGYRDRKPIACVGTLDLRIPKTRRGTFFPDDVPVGYQRADRALVAAVAEMYATGTSTRKVQRIAEKLGVDRLCFVTDNRYGVCPSLLRDQRTILTVVGTARWLVFSLTPQGCLLLESPRAIPVTRGPAMT